MRDCDKTSKTQTTKKQRVDVVHNDKPKSRRKEVKLERDGVNSDVVMCGEHVVANTVSLARVHV